MHNNTNTFLFLAHEYLFYRVEDQIVLQPRSILKKNYIYNTLVSQSSDITVEKCLDNFLPCKLKIHTKQKQK